jgi:hypothetical protein
MMMKNKFSKAKYKKEEEEEEDGKSNLLKINQSNEYLSDVTCYILFFHMLIKNHFV